MFTGIIKKVEKIKNLEHKDSSLYVAVSLPKTWKINEGQSISINGICSTVRVVRKNDFEVEYMPETIDKTSLLGWTRGYLVNLEQNLRPKDFIDGHFVSGHIDGVGTILHIEEKGSSKIFKIKLPKVLMGYIIPKGSIAIDGVSLTIASVSSGSFSVSLVSYTLQNTNFNYKKIGEIVNIEIGMMAKYFFKILENKNAKKKK